MFRKSSNILRISLIFGVLTLITIVLFYHYFDLSIAEAAHSLKGSFVVTIGNGLSELASKHVILAVTFITLIAGACDAIVNGQ